MILTLSDWWVARPVLLAMSDREATLNEIINNNRKLLFLNNYGTFLSFTVLLLLTSEQTL